MQTIYGSHSAIAPFRLRRPSHIADAAAALADGAVCLAGGVDLVPALRAGRRVGEIVALGGIGELKVIERRGAALRIGAGVSYAQLAADGAIAAVLPDLAAAWRAVANVRVRHAATIGGNLMAGNPHYDMLPALMALDATLVFAGARGQEEKASAASERRPEGLLAFIEIPLVEGRRFLFERGFKPVISVALAADGGKARAAFGCAFARPAVREFTLGGDAETAAARIANDLPEPVSDWVASGAYRRKLAGVLLGRQLHAVGRS